MKEKNLLAELAAYLFSNSDKESGRTPSERELAEHFGVSRGQIREALAILEAMRIVERRAKSGIYIDTKQASVLFGKTAGEVESSTAMYVKTARILLGTYALGGPNFLTPEHVDRIYTRPDEKYREKQIGVG